MGRSEELQAMNAAEKWGVTTVLVEGMCSRSSQATESLGVIFDPDIQTAKEDKNDR